MSMDFFNRLAAAAVESKESIRPRAPSRFEPLAEHPDENEVERPDDRSTIHPAAAVKPHPLRPQPGGPMPATEPVERRERLPTSADFTPEEKHEPPSVPHLDSDSDRVPQQPTPAPSVDDTVSAPRQATDFPKMPLPASDTGEPDLQHQPHVAATDDNVDDPSPRTVRPLVERRQQEEKDTEPTLINVKTKRSTGISPSAGNPTRIARPITPSEGDAVIPAPAVVRPREVPVSGRDRGAATSQQAADDLPTSIEISIGRIELRPQAPANAATPPASPRFEPTLSLDDYLARRQGGGQ
jgi:hypothetical protein